MRHSSRCHQGKEPAQLAKHDCGDFPVAPTAVPPARQFESELMPGGAAVRSIPSERVRRRDFFAGRMDTDALLHGVAGPGWARQGQARRGMARLGEARRGEVLLPLVTGGAAELLRARGGSAARRGVARRGEAWPGEARRGEAWQGK